MTDETNLPSGADLDAAVAEQQNAAATAPAKAAHDAVLDDLTKDAPLRPALRPSPETEAAIAYVMSKGYEREAAIVIVTDNGVDTILAAKANEEAAQRLPVKPIEAKIPLTVEQVQEGLTVSRHGEVFNPAIHAQLPTGDPKTDSTGRFILKDHDYRGPRPNSQFPD